MRPKKEITAFQINNVLRVYGEQLRRGRILDLKRFTNTDKEIEGNSETINSKSTENSKFLTSKLKT